MKIEIVKKLEEAFESKKWQEIYIEDLEILIKIAEGKDKAEIAQNLYQGIKPDSPSGEKVRGQVDNLYKKNLVWLEGYEETKKVSKFHVHPELYKELKKEFPHLCKSKTELETFDFTITRDMARFKSDAPHFRGQFILEKNVELRKDKRYRYTGIINDDGSIAIRIQEEKITNRNPELEKPTKELVRLKKVQKEK